MASSKSKSSLSETPTPKSRVSSTSIPSPRVSRMGYSPSPKPRLSLDRPKLSSSSPPLSEKQSSRTLKGSGLQSQLNLLQDEFKKAKEHLALVEKEKAKLVEELREAQKVTDGINEKIRDALIAQKKAEEDSEIEKFRAVEIEQAGIEAIQKKEVEWQKELETVRNQHTADAATLLSTTRELRLVQREMALAVDAKNHAVIQANDATKIAEVHVKKNEVLSVEITRLKDAHDLELERKASENKGRVLQLKEEIDVLSRELESFKGIEKKLMERDASIEHLNVDLEAAKLAESNARSLVEEWKGRVEELEKSLEEANELERTTSESLRSAMKEMTGSNDLLHDAKAEICALKEKVASLEMTTARQTSELEEASRILTEVKDEFEDMEKATDILRSDLDALTEEKDRALNSERVASSNVQSLLEEKARLVDAMKISKEEEEKSKKARESLASALHEVSAEARDAKEKLVCIQIEHENCEAQLEDLRLVLKATSEKYEAMIYDAKGEMDHLASAVEQSRYEYEASKEEWEQKELHLVDCVKQSEQEKHVLQESKEALENFLRQAEGKASDAEQREALISGSLKEAEDEVLYLQGAIGETKAESLKLKESFVDKENELQDLIQENDELRVREAASIRRIEELSKLLEEATTKRVQPVVENGDLLPTEVDSSDDTAHMDALLLPEEGHQRDTPLETDISFKDKPDEAKEDDEEEEGGGGVDPGEKKDSSPEGETEDEEEELEMKADGDDESFEQENVTNSSEHVDGKPNSKKKKPLLRKFGSLLKKKGASSSTPKQEEDQI